MKNLKPDNLQATASQAQLVAVQILKNLEKTQELKLGSFSAPKIVIGLSWYTDLIDRTVPLNQAYPARAQARPGSTSLAVLDRPTDWERTGFWLNAWLN